MEKVSLLNCPTLILGLFLVGFNSFGQDKNNMDSQHYNSYAIHGNNLTLVYDSGSKLSLTFLDAKNIKFWFSPDGSFKRNNESFAVIDETFHPAFQINVQESNTNLEVFTENLRVTIQKSPLKIRIFDKYQRLIMGDFEDRGLVAKGSKIIAKKTLRKDERFIGLGEKAGPLNRRGRSYTMWNSDKPCYSEEEDPLYKSIPFFMSSFNYGIFFDNTYKTTFDFGETSADYFSFSTLGGPFIYYFMYGADYKEIIGSYIKLTGRPIMPPNWAFGFSQSRGLLTNEKLTREIAKGYRERNIPCDIIYQDIGWVDGLQNFDWRKEKYDNPKKMLSDLSEKGFKVIVSQDPVISQATENQWIEAKEKEFLVLDDRTGKAYDMPWPWGGNAGVVDFTNPEVAEWWGNLQQKPLDDGVKGFWTDMGEPAWSNEEDTDRLHMKHYLGKHDEIHNVYGLIWDKVVTEQFERHNPDQRVFQMTRAAYAGMQRYTFGWSGDSGNGLDVLDGWKNLANQIPIGLSAGLGGIPFWTTDISGYCGDIKDYKAFSELYIRWLQFGIFNPLSRAHHEGNNAVEPWLFGTEAERIAKEAIELKYRLHPYMYTYARKAYDTGLPIMRALVLEYPGDKETYGEDREFMFGEEILVAPVIKEGARMKKVYLPQGKWIDYKNPQKVYEGERYIDYKAPLNVIPIFVKEGAIIPKMPVMPYIGAMDNAPMILDIYPKKGASSSFTIYEDDGTTNNYKQQVYAKTKVECVDSKDFTEIIIHKPESHENFITERRNYWIQLHLSPKPVSVTLNDDKIRKDKLQKLKAEWNGIFNKSGYCFDKDLGMVYIKISDTRKKQVIRINK